VIVRLTADNPFVDIQLLDELIEIHLRHEVSYTGSSNLPVGMNFEIVNPQSIIDLENKELSSYDKEHVTSYIKNNYPIFIHEFISEESIRNVRLTIDYSSDYALVSLVASLIKEPTLKNIERIFKTYPWLKEINDGNFQKKSFKELASEINEATRILDLLELHNASKILKEKLDN
jgi:spore coat polysaccharide biosynthesis protein SpsF